MPFRGVTSNISILTNSYQQVRNLRDFILTQALSGNFSKSKPDSWKKSTLGAEVQIIRGITFPSSAKYRESANERIICLRTTNVQDQVDWSDLLYVPESYVRNQDQYIRKNDILISMANSRELVGKVSLVKRDDVRCTLGGFISAIRCGESILPEFLMMIMRAPATRERIIDSSNQTTNIANISLGRLRPLEICLPSLNEQLIIIQRVTELFNQCDELETSLFKHQEISAATRKSAVDAISIAQTPEELQIAWKRIQNNWEVIAGTPSAVDSLRKMILSFAARGKLVNSPDRFSEGSTVVELGKVCKVSWGNLSLTKSSYVENGSHLAVSAAGPDGRIGTAEHKAFTPVLSAIGARCGTMFMPNEDFTAIKNTMTLEPKSEALDSWYLYYVMMGSNLPRRGSAQPFMSKSDIENFKIRIPSLAEQKLIASRVEILLHKCDSLEVNLRKAEELAIKFSQSVVSTSK